MTNNDMRTIHTDITPEEARSALKALDWYKSGDGAHKFYPRAKGCISSAACMRLGFALRYHTKTIRKLLSAAAEE